VTSFSDADDVWWFAVSSSGRNWDAEDVTSTGYNEHNTENNFVIFKNYFTST
jgi:hypothetical protein